MIPYRWQGIMLGIALAFSGLAAVVASLADFTWWRPLVGLVMLGAGGAIAWDGMEEGR